MSDNSKVLALIQLLRENGVTAQVDSYAVIDVSFECIEVFIAPRPYYCDRGRWMVYASSNDPMRTTIDHSDMFPRYYFNDSALVAEFLSWKQARLAHIRPPL